MTDEPSISECIDIVRYVLDGIVGEYPFNIRKCHREDAIEALKMIEYHCNSVDAVAQGYHLPRLQPDDAPAPPEQYITGSKK